LQSTDKLCYERTHLPVAQTFVIWLYEVSNAKKHVSFDQGANPFNIAMLSQYLVK